MNERDDMRLKRDLDALPREIEPPTDAWPGIRTRLKPRVKSGSVGAPRVGARRLRIAALLGLLAVSAGALAITRHNAATWHLATMDGSSRVLEAGESIGGGDSLRVTVGRIGHLDVAPGTSLRVVATGMSEQRAALVRGTIHAEISAPPRLFIVETPAGTAVDLGCAYTLGVDSAGTSTIAVTAGWVSFESGPRRALIPAGMRAVAFTDGSVGTPVMDDAPDSLRAALASFDHAPSDSALGAILRSARQRDAVSLWHLVIATDGLRRERLVTKLIAMVPLPDGVTRDAIGRAEPHAMDLYWTRLPGTLPIIPSWRQTLWKIWMKVAG